MRLLSVNTRYVAHYTRDTVLTKLTPREVQAVMDEWRHEKVFDASSSTETRRA
jgi:hypothetical protein